MRSAPAFSATAPSVLTTLCATPKRAWFSCLNAGHACAALRARRNTLIGDVGHVGQSVHAQRQTRLAARNIDCTTTVAGWSTTGANCERYNMQHDGFCKRARRLRDQHCAVQERAECRARHVGGVPVARVPRSDQVRAGHQRGAVGCAERSVPARRAVGCVLRLHLHRQARRRQRRAVPQIHRAGHRLLQRRRQLRNDVPGRLQPGHGRASAVRLGAVRPTGRLCGLNALNTTITPGASKAAKDTFLLHGRAAGRLPVRSGLRRQWRMQVHERRRAVRDRRQLRVQVLLASQGRAAGRPGGVKGRQVLQCSLRRRLQQLVLDWCLHHPNRQLVRPATGNFRLQCRLTARQPHQELERSAVPPIHRVDAEALLSQQLFATTIRRSANSLVWPPPTTCCRAATASAKRRARRALM
jgi:hypothetical protein